MILKHSDNLSCALQGTKISAAEGQATASKTVKTIESLRTDEMYRLFWGKVCQTASEFEIGDPSLPRRRKRPARYEEGLSSPHFSETPQSHYRQLYYECIDSIVNCIRKRFDQPGYKTYQQMEQLLLKAVHGENYSGELAAVIEVYKDDLDATRLEIQLDTLRSSLVEDGISMDIHDILKYMQSLSASDKCLLCEVVTLAIDTIGHAQGIGNKMIVLYTPCPFLWFLINFLRRKIVLWLFSDRCSDFSSSCCLL